MDFDVSAVYDSEAECFINPKMKHLSTVLQDYNPWLCLMWVKPHLRQTEEERKSPFAVVCAPPNAAPYVVCHFGEDFHPTKVLEAIFMADGSKHNVLTDMQKRNAAARAAQAMQFQDEMLEKADLGKWLLQTRKTNPVIRDKATGELIKLDGQLNRVGKIRKTH